VRLDLTEEVVKVSTGGGHCLALTKSGRMYGWGANNCGQVGGGDLCIPEPVVLIDSGVRDIAAGLAFSLAVTHHGEVLSWGSGDFGALGVGSTSDSREPLRVNIGERILAVAAGWSHAFAVSESGVVYGWGGNQFGQIGVGTTTDVFLPTPIELPVVSPRSQISAGDAHTFLNLEGRRVFAWGGNGVGQLGDGTQVRRLKPGTLDQLTIK
jgi:alpha-tubulin suppressor-like RCC1 family protein